MMLQHLFLRLRQSVILTRAESLQFADVVGSGFLLYCDICFLVSTRNLNLLHPRTRNTRDSSRWRSTPDGTSHKVLRVYQNKWSWLGGLLRESGTRGSGDLSKLLVKYHPCIGVDYSGHRCLPI